MGDVVTPEPTPITEAGHANPGGRWDMKDKAPMTLRRRREMNPNCFLDNSKRGYPRYPVCASDNDKKYECAAIVAAKRRAGQYKNEAALSAAEDLDNQFRCTAKAQKAGSPPRKRGRPKGSGTKKPKSPKPKGRTLKELREHPFYENIKGRSKMSKAELEDALNKFESAGAAGSENRSRSVSTAAGVGFPKTPVKRKPASPKTTTKKTASPKTTKKATSPGRKSERRLKLEAMTQNDLRKLAGKGDIKGRSKMTKAELIKRIMPKKSIEV
jgi:hypothetical protein